MKGVLHPEHLLLRVMFAKRASRGPSWVTLNNLLRDGRSETKASKIDFPNAIVQTVLKLGDVGVIDLIVCVHDSRVLKACRGNMVVWNGLSPDRERLAEIFFRITEILQSNLLCRGQVCCDGGRIWKGDEVIFRGIGCISSL